MLVMHASNCAESPNVKDFMISAYTRPMALGIIRANDTERVKKAFGEFCNYVEEKNREKLEEEEK